ncbi:MAG: hypothetical protein U0264_18510 [Candidatus Kapaibacterium sp.]
MDILRIAIVSLVAMLLLILPLFFELLAIVRMDSYQKVLVWLLPYCAVKYLFYWWLCLESYGLYLAARGHTIGSPTDAILSMPQYSNDMPAMLLGIMLPIATLVIVKLLFAKFVPVRSKGFYWYDIPTNFGVSIALFFWYAIVGW